MLVPDVTAPVPAALELTLHDTAVPGLFVPVTVALNCSVLPAAVVLPVGLTVTFVTVGCAMFTVTLADFDESNADTAKT